MSSGRIVLKYFSKHWYLYVIGIVLLIIHSVLDTYIPKQTGLIIDLFEAKAEKAEVLHAVLVLVIYSILTFWFFYIWRYILVMLCRGIDRDERYYMFSHLQKLSQDFYLKNNTGDLITRSILDIKAVRAFFGNHIVTLINTIASIIIAIYFMQDSAGWRITLYCIAPTPLLVGMLFLIRKTMRKRFREVQLAASDIGTRVQENVTGIRVIKSFAQEKAENEKFSLLSRAKWRAEMRSALISSSLNPLVRIVYAATFCIFLIFGGREVIDGRMSIGEFTAFNGYMLQILNPMNSIGNIVHGAAVCRVGLGRLNEIFFSVPTVTDARADFAMPQPKELELSVRHLTFSYPNTDEPVLRDISFSVHPGELVSVMGPTGCGKTTLAALLDRLWEPREGQIFLNGQEIHTVPLAVLRTAIASVPQDTLLFTDTIENNIRFFHEGLSHEDVEACARLSDVHESIASFPDGYETRVGERGATLSGGQKQRIAIARAAVTRPCLLILDDSLSAVDTETEARILQNLKRDRRGCSVLLITHRISAAMLSDKVLFLNEQGGMEGFASHAELMESSAEYRHLFENASGARAEGGHTHG